MSPTTKNWIIATRPWSFPASAMPALFAMAYVFYMQDSIESIHWGYGVAALLGAVLFQASGNLIGDYFDYMYKVDRKESLGSSRMLVDGVFTPKTIFWFGIIVLCMGILLGLFLWSQTGNDLLWIGIVGALGTFFYYKLKYMALGDVLIFVIYGPLIALGTAFVMTNQLYWEVVVLSIPIAFLVVNILHANNTRDMRDDKLANIKTQALLLGEKGSRIQYTFLAIGAYVAVAIFVLLNMISPLALLVIVTLPLAKKNINLIKQAKIDKPEIIKDLDAMSAQLVMAFTLMYALGIFNGYWI
ncbi:MAG: prenyltransferase [Paludibacteraceae bacterium]|jgi:1,4-dihydroxy-2-naphthoate octaprenyltransferase|nr:prenyltransferase [Paludibacteraceae bacterium]HOR40665.1 prenyltransferase [Paludibacteraceae bacterium]